jgi:hypothetical protein
MLPGGCGPVGHLVAVAESVIATGVATQLAAASSMYALIVAERPIPEPPYSVVFVRSAVSVRPPAPGKVVIEHCSLTGRVDRIERPIADTVPLFWRFRSRSSASLRARLRSEATDASRPSGSERGPLDRLTRLSLFHR